MFLVGSRVIGRSIHGSENDRADEGNHEIGPTVVWNRRLGNAGGSDAVAKWNGPALEQRGDRIAGLRTRLVRYHSTQPWPYPSTLMIGLLAEVEDDEGTPDQTELSDIRWFTRAEARDLLAGRLDGVFAPPRLAIAHQLIKAWSETG